MVFQSKLDLTNWNIFNSIICTTLINNYFNSTHPLYFIQPIIYILSKFSTSTNGHFLFWFVITGKVRAHELREKSKSDLLNQVTDLKSELASLRIAQVTGGAPAKLAKIGEVRKNIARVLTVANQIAKSKVN